jgi:small subunit ribosomal protein S4
MRLQVCILTPDCIFQKEEIDELILPTSTGQIGILRNHASLITALDVGLIISRNQSNWKTIALIGGFALVQKNQVTILVNEAVTASSVKEEEVTKTLEEANNRLSQVTEEKRKVEAVFAYKRARVRYQIIQWKKSDTTKYLKTSIMSRYRGARLRVIRRLGRLPALTKKIPKRNTRPGQHGASRKKLTQFSYRLIEKQKLRFYYGISEKQLVRYIKTVQIAKGPTGQILLQKLERRLDNIIYRLGWAPTLPAARQLVTHGHILVNQKSVNIPRYACSPHEVIRIRNKDKIRNLIETYSQNHIRKLPSHLSIRSEDITATINNRESDRSEIPLTLNELLVVEYYSNRLSI